VCKIKNMEEEKAQGTPKDRRKEFFEKGRALASKIAEIQELYNSNGINVALVGSLGRYASICQDPPTLSCPEGIKDADMMVLGPLKKRPDGFTKQINLLAHPFTSHEHFGESVLFENGGTLIRYKDIELNVNPKIFQIRKGVLFGVEVDTLDPNTLFHLGALYGPFRPKDWKALLDFGRRTRRRPDILPENLFEPFHRLAYLREKRYPKDTLIGKARWAYHKKVSYRRRVSLSRIVAPTRSVISRGCGWIEAPHK
jgi:hypothetical protein